MGRPTKPQPESEEQRKQREYREMTNNVSADRLVPYEIYRLRLALNALSENTGKWQAEIKNSIEAGFEKVAKAIADNQPLPQPQPKLLEVRFVFKVANDHQDEPFSIAIGGVTDAEGEPLPNQDGLTVDVKSSDDAVVAVSFDSTTNSGVASFGHSGVASLTASVTNKKGEILGSGAADFTVTTGDPAAISDVKISFGGLTEEPPA